MADQFDSVTGGGSGFSVDNVQNTSVTFNVPTSGSFDIYVSDNYAGTSSQPDGLYDLTLAAVQGRDSTSPAQIQFVFPSTGVDPGGVYTSEFTATWSDPLASGDYIRESEFDTRADQWWETEVKPELEAINTTLTSILTQLTPTVALAADSGAQALADQITRVREQLTPVVDEATDNTLADQVAKIRTSVRHTERRYKMARLYISTGSANNGSIGMDNDDSGSSYSTSLQENGTLSISSSRSGYTTLYLLPVQYNGDDIDTAYLVREGLTGQGTSSISWNTKYGDKGTYFIYRDTGDGYSQVGTVTITVNDEWIQDEKVTSSTNSTTGYIETYSPTSARGNRFLDIVDIKRNDSSVENIVEDFVIGESITGELSGITAIIEDIIYINHEHENYNQGSGIGEAALYQLMAEQGSANDVSKNVSAEERQQAITAIRSLKNSLRDI